MERAFEVISSDPPDEDLALLAAALSRAYWFRGDLERAAERAELALDIAEAQAYPAALAIALRSKGAVAFSRGHVEESGALMLHALKVALEHDLLDQAATTYFILSDREFRWDRYREALAYLEEALKVSRKVGSRPSELADLAEMTYPLYMLGRWDEALGLFDELTEEQTQSGGVLLSLLISLLEIHLARGRFDEAQRIFSLFSHLEGSNDMQDRSSYLAAQASLSWAEGKLDEALAHYEPTIEAGRTLGHGQQSVKQAAVVALEAAIALGDSAKARELIDSLEDASPSLQSPYLTAQAHRFRGRLDEDEAELEAASRIFRELELPFWLAVTLLEQSETLAAAGRVDDAAPYLEEAREIFGRLEATPWLERAERATAGPSPSRSAGADGSRRTGRPAPLGEPGDARARGLRPCVRSGERSPRPSSTRGSRPSAGPGRHSRSDGRCSGGSPRHSSTSRTRSPRP